MAVELNHTIIYARDKRETATFFAEILGLPPPRALYNFLVLGTANGVSLDVFETKEPVAQQHYAFLVSEKEFDEIFGRIKARKLSYWADPARREPGEINTSDGGRGVYFADPSDHMLEIITRPYGS